jgi:antitoxin MazE
MHGKGERQARVFRSGNSLAIRIPGGMAKQLDLQEGTEMDIEIEDGRLSLRPAGTPPSLDDLVDRITADNVHAEQIPNLVGRERW